MTVKLLGSLAMLGIAAVLAARGVAVFRERLLQLEGFVLLLRSIREQIACFRTPTREILAAFQNPALERAGFLAAAKRDGMAAALEESRERLYLDGEELGPLREFSAGLGGGYADEEVARCELCLARLTEAVARRREALPKAAKLYRTLVLGGALAVIIVLI